MGASNQLQMCLVNTANMFQGTQQLMVKGQLGEGGFCRVFRVAKVPSSSSSSNIAVPAASAGVELAAGDMALKAAKVTEQRPYNFHMEKLQLEYIVPRDAQGIGKRFLVIPEAVGFLQCANGGEWPCLLMEMAPHGCLLDVVCPGGIPKGMSPRAAAHVMACMVHAVAAMHFGGYIHRDLKPHNILLFGTKERPVPKLADFGLAGGISNNRSAWTLCGTRGMQAPEMILGGGQDSCTDVYCLGLLLLYIRWGRMPFWYLDIKLGDTPAVAAGKLARQKDPLAELQHPECPYTSESVQPDGPVKLTVNELDFLGKTFGKLRYKSADLISHPLVMGGLGTYPPYWE